MLATRVFFIVQVQQKQLIYHSILWGLGTRENATRENENLARGTRENSRGSEIR